MQFQVFFLQVIFELSKWSLFRVLNTAITCRRKPSAISFASSQLKNIKNVAEPVNQDFTYRRCKLSEARPNFLFIDVKLSSVVGYGS